MEEYRRKQLATFPMETKGCLHIARYYLLVFLALTLAAFFWWRHSSNERAKWFDAASNGDVDVLASLLSQGRDVNTIYLEFSPLHRRNDRCTALHLAAENGHAKCVKFLLERGADPCIEGFNRAIPLGRCFDAYFNFWGSYQEEKDSAHPGTEQRRVDYLNCLNMLFTASLECSRALNFEPLAHSVVILDKPELLEMTKVECISDELWRKTLVPFALRYGRVNVLKAIFDRFPDLTLDNEQQNIAGSPPETIPLLVEHHFYINEKDMSGATILHYATRGSYREMIQVLLEKGASPNIPDSEGRTAIDLAANKEVKELLLKYSSERKQSDTSNTTSEAPAQ